MTAHPHEYSPDVSTDEMFWRTLHRPLQGADSLVERFMLAVAGAWIQPGDFVVDLGANHGQHARVLGAGLGQGLLLLVEADPVLADELRHGAAASSVPIDVVNAAVGDSEAREIIFYRHPTRDQEGSMYRREEETAYEEVAVPGMSIDSLLVDRGAPSFMKIDVEGAEFGALRGAASLLQEHDPLIACELSETAWSDTTAAAETPGYSLIEFVEWLAGVGWSLFTLDGQLVTAPDVQVEGFGMHYQAWLAKSGSRAEAFVTTTVPLLANAFAWGASQSPPYPFYLDRNPISASPRGPGLERLTDFLRARAAMEAAPVEAPHDSGTAVTDLEETIRRIQLKTEALEQTSFERERMVAWYATEVSNHRHTAETREQDLHSWRRHAEDTDQRLGDLLVSSSWRSTLPIRVVRRPRTYLRKLLQG